MNSLIRLLKIAETLSNSGEIEAFNSFYVQFDAFVKKDIIKNAHYEAKNDGTTPNPLRRNLDYDAWENSPYYGNVAEFLKKFPGGIKDWLNWRNKTEKERFQMWDSKKIKERKARLELIMKEAEIENKMLSRKEKIEMLMKEAEEQEKFAHFEPVGPDNTKDFPKEPHLYSGDMDEFESVKEYIEKRRKSTGQAADDAALSAAKDFVNYYKLLLKGKK